MQEGRQSIQAFLEEVRAKIPVPVKWESGDHIASRLLTPEENTKVMKIVGKKRRTLATTVAQVWFAYPKEENAWKVKFTGVLCFVKDSTMKSHFIRLLNIDKGDETEGVIWEQEIYKQFRYKAVKENFHTFEGDYCNIGLNFCDVEEATYFHQCIKERIAFFRKLRATIKAKREMRNTKIGENPAARDIITSVRVRHGIHVTTQKLKAKYERQKHSQDEATGSTCSSATISSNNEKGNMSLIQFPGEEDLKSATSDPLKNEQYKQNAATAIKNQHRQSEVVSAWISSAPGQSSAWDMLQVAGQNSSSEKRSLDKRRNTIPLLKPVSHPVARRNQLLLCNNKMAMKLQEQQRECHSSMIKSLVMGRDTKTKQKELSRGVDDSKQTEVMPKNRSKALQNPVAQIADENKTREGGIMAQEVQNSPVVSNVPEKDSDFGLPCDIWESNFSFPALPSTDKLDLTAVSAVSHAALHAGDLRGSEVVPSVNSDASSEKTAQQSSATPAVAPDTRGELMKSIIAGKKLNKVDPPATVRRPVISAKDAVEDMVGCLSKALEGRNKVLRDSSSDDDDYDYDDYEWEEHEEWD